MSDTDTSDYTDDYWYLRNVLQKVLKRVDPLHYKCELLGPFNNFIEYPQNTALLDVSDFAMMTKLASGESRSKKEPSNIVNMLTNRQKGQFSNKNFSKNTKCNINNRCVPNKFDILVGHPGEVYCSEFTKDGQLFVTASEDEKINIYNSGNGFYNIEKSMKIDYSEYAITDLKCSPDNEHFVYSTLYPIVYLCKLAYGSNEQYPLVMDDPRFADCISCVSFSTEGRELLCSSSDGIVYIYDLESGRRTLKFLGHEQDVNSVRFADDSGNILYTASNDKVVKLWDRRTLSEGFPIPEIYLVGHRAGIMDMDVRGDGRHLITHSKDQSIKLWDIRAPSSAEVANEAVRIVTEEDYGNRFYPNIDVNGPTGLDGDTSIMTYRGHRVKHIKITCKFSPIETTGQRYIYTGCNSGRVVVYDALTGKAVQQQVAHCSCVRNVSWHPTRNEILSSGSDGLVGIWRYVDPNTMMEPEHVDKYWKHFSNYKIKDGLLVDTARNVQMEEMEIDYDR